MSRLFALLFLRWVHAEECTSKPDVESSSSASLPLRKAFTVRQPRPEPVLADIVGLEDAKQVLREAVILPSSMPVGEMQLFRRSGLRSGVLLCGPSGLDNEVIEAAAAASGALVLPIPSTEVVSSNFCRTAIEAVVTEKQPVVVIIEALDEAPVASLSVQQCLREAAGQEDSAFRLFIVATMARNRSALSATILAPFGYVVESDLPSEAERKQFLLNLLKQISRVDPIWGGALNQAAVSSLANLTASYTFSEIELVVRRAFVRSSNDKGSRDPVALHHFEQILTTMPPQAASIGVHEVSLEASQSTGGEPAKNSPEKNAKKKEMKDPMDGIFGWCNFWLPEALHLPPVVWAMIIFGVLAHFMARSTYPVGNRRRSGRRPGFPPDFGNNAFGSLSTDGGLENLHSSMSNWPMPPHSTTSGIFGGPGGLPMDGATSSSSRPEGVGGSSPFPTAGDPIIGGPS